MVKKFGFLVFLFVFISGCAANINTKRLDEMDMKVTTMETRLSAVEQRQSFISSSSEEPSAKAGGVKEGYINPAQMTKKDIQTGLKNANFYNGPIDGELGPKTRSAIKEFQKANGLTADGVAGKETKQKLVEYLKVSQ